MTAGSIGVEVVYALPGRQTLLKVAVPAGATVSRALADSGILALHPEIDPAALRVGVFGQFVELDHALDPGDRVEIYRPLVADPKESRHARVAKRRANRDSEKNMRA